MPGGMVEQPAAKSAVTASENTVFNVADVIGFLCRSVEPS
jgi:hypothetical protein